MQALGRRVTKGRRRHPSACHTARRTKGGWVGGGARAAGRTSLRNWTGVFLEGTSSCAPAKRRKCLSWLSGELGMETTERSAASSSSERRDLPAERGRWHVSTSHCGRGRMHCVAQWLRRVFTAYTYLPWRCWEKLPASESELESALSDERSRLTTGAHSRFPSSRDSSK